MTQSGEVNSMFSYTVYPITRSVGQAFGISPVERITPVKPVHNSKTVRPVKSGHDFRVVSKNFVQPLQHGSTEPFESAPISRGGAAAAVSPGCAPEVQLMHAAPLLSLCRAPTIPPEQDIVSPYARELAAYWEK